MVASVIVAAGAGAAEAGAAAGARGAAASRVGASERALAEQRAAQARSEQFRRRLQQLQNQRTEDSEEAIDEETESRDEPKIATVMVILGFLYLGTLDLIGLILLFFGLDDFFILDFLALPVLIYLRRVGANTTFNLFMQLAAMIPYIGSLPWKTVGWGVTVWIDRHPKGRVAKTAQVAQKATAQVSRFKPRTNVAA